MIFTSLNDYTLNGYMTTCIMFVGRLSFSSKSKNYLLSRYSRKKSANSSFKASRAMHRAATRKYNVNAGKDGGVVKKNAMFMSSHDHIKIIIKL